MSKTPKSTFSFQNSHFRFKFFFDQNLDFVLGQPLFTQLGSTHNIPCHRCKGCSGTIFEFLAIISLITMVISQFVFLSYPTTFSLSRQITLGAFYSSNLLMAIYLMCFSERASEPPDNVDYFVSLRTFSSQTNRQLTKIFHASLWEGMVRAVVAIIGVFGLGFDISGGPWKSSHDGHTTQLSWMYISSTAVYLLFVCGLTWYQFIMTHVKRVFASAYPIARDGCAKAQTVPTGMTIGAIFLLVSQIMTLLLHLGKIDENHFQPGMSFEIFTRVMLGTSAAGFLFSIPWRFYKLLQRVGVANYCCVEENCQNSKIVPDVQIIL